MNVAILTHFYPPEPCAAATRVRSLVDSLTGAGNRVTVITNFASFPNGKVKPADWFRMLQIDDDGPARIVRVFTRTYRGFPLARLWHWATAALSSSLFLLLRRERYDIVIVSLPPITLAFPALVAAWRHRSKLVVDVRDVYPDIAIAMGEWSRNGLFARVSEVAARLLYRRANLIVAVTPTALRQIALRGVDRRRLVLAPNGCEDVTLPDHSRNGRAFTAIYAGNLGVATDVDLLVDAAELVASDGIIVEIAGDGAEGARMRDRARKKGLRNLLFAGSVDRPIAMQMLGRADVTIVSLRAGICESVPTKLWDALSLGSPVILAGEGEAAEAARASGGALCVPPGDADALAAAIRALSKLEKSALRAMGMRGREYVINHYRRAAIMADLSKRITRV